LQAPHELLFHIFAAVNEEKAQKQIKSANVSMTVNVSKIKAAKKILSEFKTSTGDSALLLQQTTELIEAYIQLADHRQSNWEISKVYSLPTLLKRLKWSQEQSRVPVPTASGHAQDGNLALVGSFEGWTYPGACFALGLCMNHNINYQIVYMCVERLRMMQKSDRMK
jgi:hypothetical protein